MPTQHYSIRFSVRLSSLQHTRLLRLDTGKRETPHYSLSQPTLLIRSLAKLGLWAGVLGTAANRYYHTRFTSVVVAQKTHMLKPWKLYDSTMSFTVDDGCLLGAGLGFAASVPILFLRRPVMPRWTRCLGLTNGGACIGIVGAHGYLQYTIERQKRMYAWSAGQRGAHSSSGRCFGTKT